MRRVLFITWDGPDQTYLESLFFPIFSGLLACGIAVDTLQLTWAGTDKISGTTTAARGLNLGYRALTVPRYLRKLGLPALLGAASTRVLAVARSGSFEAIMPRSLIPASVALAVSAVARRPRLVFEADGLMADERVDFSGWSPNGPAYHTLRRIERATIKHADAVITRTSRAQEILLERGGPGTEASKIFVVPNSRDSLSFVVGDAQSNERVRHAAGVPPNAPWLVYAGSLGPQYHVPEMLKLFRAVRARRPDARLHFFTFRPEELTRWAHGQSLEGVTALTIAPAVVPVWLAAADLGLALRANTFSQRAVCPIKVIEYLMSGLPVMATAVGDLQAQLGGKGVGHVFETLADEELERAAAWFVDDALRKREEYRTRCRKLAESTFDLGPAVRRYAEAIEHACASARVR